MFVVIELANWLIRLLRTVVTFMMVGFLMFNTLKLELDE